MNYGLWGLGPLLVVTVSHFLLNLWLAPAEIERIKHDETKRELAEARTSLAEKIQIIQDDNPIRTNPTTGASVIGKSGGPTVVMGGIFRSGLRIEEKD